MKILLSGLPEYIIDYRIVPFMKKLVNTEHTNTEYAREYDPKKLMNQKLNKLNLDLIIFGCDTSKEGEGESNKYETPINLAYKYGEIPSILLVLPIYWETLVRGQNGGKPNLVCNFVDFKKLKKEDFTYILNNKKVKIYYG